MSFELARAFIRVAIDRQSVRSETAGVRTQTERQLSGIKVKIDRTQFQREAAQAGAQAGRAAKQAFNGSFKGGLPAGWAAGAAKPFPTLRGGPMPPMPGGAIGNRFGGGGGGGAGGGFIGGGGGGGGLGGFARGAFQTAAGIMAYRAAIHTIMAPVKAIQTATNFEEEIGRAGDATEATAAQRAMLRRSALGQAGRGIFGTRDIGHAARIIAEKGMSAEQTAGALPTVLKFAAGSGGKVNTEQAADVLIGIMNSMRIPMEDMEKTADMLARAALKSSTDVHDLGEALKFVGPLADLAGMQLDEVSAALMVLSKKNLGGSIGGTGFKRIITEFFREGGLDKIGEATGKKIVTFNDAGKMRPLADIVDEVNAAFKNIPAQKLGAIMEEFQQRAGPQFLALLQAGGDEIRKMQGTVNDLGITLDSLEQKQLTRLGAKFDRFAGAVSRLAVTKMDPLLGPLGILVDNLTEAALAAERTNFALSDMADWRFLLFGKAGQGLGLGENDVLLNGKVFPKQVGNPVMAGRQWPAVKAAAEAAKEKELQQQRANAAIGGLGAVRDIPGFFDNMIPRKRLEGGLMQGFGAILGGPAGRGLMRVGAHHMKPRMIQDPVKAIEGLQGLLEMADNAMPRRKLEGGVMQALGAMMMGGPLGGIGAGLMAGGAQHALGGKVFTGEFRPSLVGIEELQKQIQVGVVGREEKLQQDQLTGINKVAANTDGLVQAIENLELGFA